MITTVVFDFDGTIADTFNLSTQLINSLAAKYDFTPFSAADIEVLRAKNMRDIFRHLNIPLFKAPLIVGDLKKLMHKQIASQQPIKGIPELLLELKQKKYVLDIITSNAVDTVTAFLNRHNLELFDHIYSDKSLFGKHVVINKYLKKHHINPGEAIYVGDEIRDIQAARKAGLKIISVTWGFNTQSSLRLYHPDHIADTPADILNFI